MPRFHMRRAEREITDPGAIDSIMRRGRHAAVAMIHEDEPYVVMLSYGWDAERRALYFHTANAGRKLDAIAADPRVCATIAIESLFEPDKCEQPYESVVLTGRMSVVTDIEEKRHGMRTLVVQLADDPETVWSRNRLDGDTVYARTTILRLDIDEISAKAGA